MELFCKSVKKKFHQILTKKFENYYSTNNNKQSSRTTMIKKFQRNQKIKVIKTRGTPSTSTDLKEALCEKIPLHYDLVREFRKNRGSSTVDRITIDDLYNGMNGVVTTIRETSEMDKKCVVKYRGLTMDEVVSVLPRKENSPIPEGVFWFLLTGDIPTIEQISSLREDWTSRRKNLMGWWSKKEGGTVCSVLESLPKNLSPVCRLSIALTTLRAQNNVKKGIDKGIMKHEHWEYTYEDSMEVLAVLPAIVGLVGDNNRDLNNISDHCGDWVDILLKSLGNIDDGDNYYLKKTSLAEFLRLYITINADEDGGSPGAHVTQILGDANSDPSQALAAGALGYANEPESGSMLQYMNFQKQVQNKLGYEPSRTDLKNYIGLLIERSVSDIDLFPPGYKESELFDPRYEMLMKFAIENFPKAPDIELSRKITETIIPIIKEIKSKNYKPDQTTIAAPIFQFYGIRDMEFNQIFLCMSRALGATASIIWSKIMNVPVERPRSRTTFSYVEAISKLNKKF